MARPCKHGNELSVCRPPDELSASRVGLCCVILVISSLISLFIFNGDGAFSAR